MIRKYHNYILQTNPLHREEEPQNIYNNKTPEFFCSVALRPKSTAMVMAGRSVHLTTLFPGQA